MQRLFGAVKAKTNHLREILRIRDENHSFRTKTLAIRALTLPQGRLDRGGIKSKEVPHG